MPDWLYWSLAWLWWLVGAPLTCIAIFLLAMKMSDRKK